MFGKFMIRVLEDGAVVLIALSLQGCAAIYGASYGSFKELTPQEIGGLKTEVTEEQGGGICSFMAWFKQREAPKKEKAGYVKSGKIPFMIACSLFEISMKDGKQVFDRSKGTAFFVMKDSAGRVVDKKSLSLDDLYPPVNVAEGGYRGEAPKEGEYTVVIWTKHSKGVFGREMTTKLVAVKP